MARALTSIPDIDAPNAEYPSGRIRNEDSPVVGTPIIEELYGDIIQFFHKLIRLGGITLNGLPESETNTFQLIEALQSYIRTVSGTEALKGVWQSASNAEVQAGLLTSKIVTPVGLQSKIATNAEALAGSITNKLINPWQLRLLYGGVLRKLITFTWNMDTDAGRNINHGLAFEKIIGVNVLVENSAGTLKAPLNYDLGGTGAAGNVSITSTQLQMLRINGGLFDSASFASGNKYAIIDYII